MRARLRSRLDVVTPGGSPNAVLAKPLGVSPSWRAEGPFSSHCVSTPSSTSAVRFTGLPSPSNAREPKPPIAQRIVDQVDARREHLLAHLVLQERHAARNGRPGDRADEGAEQPARQALCSKITGAVWLSSLRAPRRGCRALAGFAADPFGRFVLRVAAFG